MADRGAGKTSRRPAKSKTVGGARSGSRPFGPGQGPEEGADPGARIRALEAERDQLKAQLESALARVRALEQARDLVRNRIDWVIDSLHNLLDE